MLNTLIRRQNLRFTISFLLLIGIVFWLQIWLLPNLNLIGAVPNLLLVMIILVALIFGYELSLPFACFVALVFGEFLYDHFFFLSWLMAPFLAVFTFPPLNFNSRFLVFLQVILVSTYVQAINAAIFSGIWELNAFQTSISVFWIEPLLNGLLSMPLLWLIERLFLLEDSHRIR